MRLRQSQRKFFRPLSALLAFSLLTPLILFAQEKKRNYFVYWNNRSEGEIGSCQWNLSIEDKLTQQARIFGRPNSPSYTTSLSSYEKKVHWDGIVFQNPYSILDALVLRDVEKQTEKLFQRFFSKYSNDPKSNDDEGDAFRHFVFASLLVRELGLEKAEYYLAVHERGDFSMSSMMDRYNNQVAFEEAKKAVVKAHPNYFAITALEYIERGILVVIRPKNVLPRATKLNTGDKKFRDWAKRELDYVLE